MSVFTVLALSSCDVNNDIVTDEYPQKRLRFSSFGFFAEDNKGMSSDYILTNTDSDTLRFYIRELNDVSSLIPRYTGAFKSVRVGKTIIGSGYSSQDYNNIIKFDLEDKSGFRDSCFVKVICFNGIPIIDIEIENNAAVVSKNEYVNGRIKIYNCPELGIISDNDMKIRGRGNATWSFPKKPYKIKFKTKQSPFGFPLEKDWILLAEYRDRSLLRTAIMAEVSKAAGIDYTINYKHVDLYLNHEYMGTYLLTDQIEKSKERIDVNKDGFIIEHDSYYYNEPLFFTTDSLHFNFTFKYPDADNESIIQGDDNFSFISSYINRMEEALLELANKPSDLQYTNYIDVNSFVKFYLVVELTANFDPNRYYVMKSRDSLLKMMPLWDAEWSLGLYDPGWSTVPSNMSTTAFWRKPYYFKYLFQSPFFIQTLKKEWLSLKEQLPMVEKIIYNLCDKITTARASNWEKWPISGILINNVSFETWEEEKNYMINFYQERKVWFDEYISNL